MVWRKVVSGFIFLLCWWWVMMGLIRAYSGVGLGFSVIGGGGCDRLRRFCSCACESRIRRAMAIPSANCWSGPETLLGSSSLRSMRSKCICVCSSSGIFTRLEDMLAPWFASERASRPSSWNSSSSYKVFRACRICRSILSSIDALACGMEDAPQL